MAADKAQMAALDGLRRAMAQMLEVCFAELDSARRSQLDQALGGGQIELAAVMTAERLDVRMDIVRGIERHNLLRADGDYRALDVTVN